MNLIIRTLLLIFILLAILYLLGPEPPKPVFGLDLPGITSDLVLLEQQIIRKEQAEPVKPDNEARIIWANDSVKERTAWSMLYLHGFSASWYEGYPINMDFVREFGCNAYFARLPGHGVQSEDALLEMTPDALWESAKEALMITRRLGNKVLIMSSSSGSTLALKLAAEFPEYIDGLIVYSPNIRINNAAAFLLSKPWGLQIARTVYRGKYRITNEDADSRDCSFWHCKYRLESVVFLQQLVEKTMQKELFKRITCPVFMGYYFRDKENQDDVVKVDAARVMFQNLGTPDDLKMEKAFPNAETHIIACELFSKAVEDVRTETFTFAADILRMKSE